MIMKMLELGTILQMTKGKTPVKQSTKAKAGYMPYVDIEAFETGIVKQYTTGEKCVPCKEGDILIVCDGSRSGLVGKAINGYVGSTLAKISADGVDNQYLYYFLQGKYTLFNTRKKGTGTPHLKPELLKTQKLFAPDYSEQRRIVSRIEELLSQLESGVETLNTVKRQLAAYRQAVLKEAFLSCPATVSLDSVCQHITDGDHMPPPKSASGVPFIMISNITDNVIDWSNTAYVGRDYFDNIDGKRKPQKGDVLYTVTGSFGIPVMIDFDKEFCFQRHIALLRPKDSINQRFLFYALQSPIVYAQANKKATGTAQKTVGLGVLRKIAIPFFEGLENQAEIASDIERKLSVCDNIEQTVNAALRQSEAMRQSILKRAFEGEL